MPVYGCHRALAGNKQYSSARKPIGMVYPGGTNSRYGSSKLEYVIESGWPMVSAADLNYNEMYPVIFHLPVFSAPGTHQLDAALFKIGQIVCMMNPALGIGFLVPDADFELMLLNHGHARIVEKIYRLVLPGERAIALMPVAIVLE